LDAGDKEALSPLQLEKVYFLGIFFLRLDQEREGNKKAENKQK